MTDAALNINCNIRIRVIDDKGKLINERYVHNKANRALVNGIIQYLQGSFNPSEFNDPYERYSNPEQAIINNAYGAKRYIPSCNGVGNIGVTTPNHELQIDQSLFVKPTFFESGLQQPMDIPRIKFRRVRPTRGYDINNSEGLTLTTILPKGYLVVVYENGEPKHNEDGSLVYRDDYFWYYGENGAASEDDKKRAMAITEIGLYSNTDTSEGLLLARVLLDGKLSDDPTKASKGVMADNDYQYNPLIQTENTSVVIEWKIGIISIGTNDEFITESDPNIPTDPVENVYPGPYHAESYTDYADILPTMDKLMTQNFEVRPITTRSTATAHSEGNTLIIGNSHNE